MPAQQTYYIIDDSLFISEGLENDYEAADFFRETWRRAADPNSDFPFRRGALETAFARQHSEAEYKGLAPVSDQGLRNCSFLASHS